MKQTAARENIARAEVWRVDTAAAGPFLDRLARECSLLSDDEMAFAAAMRSRDPERAIRWPRMRTALRLLLMRFAGAEAAMAAIETLPGGKPALAAGSVHFSWSHCNDDVLIALSDERRVGVDFEMPRSVHLEGQRRDLILAAGRLLATEDALDANGGIALLQSWVRLEAFAKVHGLGVGKILSALRENARTADAAAAANAALAGINRIAAANVRALLTDDGSQAALALEGLQRFTPPLIQHFPVRHEDIARIAAP